MLLRVDLSRCTHFSLSACRHGIPRALNFSARNSPALPRCAILTTTKKPRNYNLVVVCKHRVLGRGRPKGRRVAD